MKKTPRPGPETARQAVDPARGRGGVPPEPKALKTLNRRHPLGADRTGAGRRGAALRAAIYLRVSKQEQNLENQRTDVERLIAARGYELVETFEEKSSSWRERTAFASMRFAARRGEFNVLIVWAIDRFGRSMAKNLNDVLELDRLGVELVSVQEPWLDTRGPVRDLLLVIFSWVAEQERARLIERTNAGLERARARGVKLGRPRRHINAAQLDRVKRMRANNYSVREIARALGIPKTLIWRVVDELEAVE